MGIFGGLGKAFKGYDPIERLQIAGAIANGDYGTAGQIRALGQRQRDEAAKQQTQQQQMEATVAALEARGIPRAEAVVIARGGGGDTVLAQYNAPKAERAPSEFERTLEAAGIQRGSPEWVAVHKQRAATLALPAPSMIGSPETGYQWVNPPAPSFSPGAMPGMPGVISGYGGGTFNTDGTQATPVQRGGPQPGAVVGGFRFKGGNPNDQNSWEPVSGGAGSNAGSNFLDAFGSFRP